MWYVKVGYVLMVASLQFIVFYATYNLYHIIQYPFYFDFEMWFDDAIPYVEWSWIIYYFGFVYISFWGAAGIWHMSDLVLRGTIKVYISLVLIGGLLHLIIPSDSPWPLIENLSDAQHSFKSATNIEPLAGFPSMHVAMASLPAFISVYVFKSKVMKLISVLLALMVSISIITAKEHWAIDAPAGLALGLLAGYVWKRYVLTC
jgi:membrane-associated phospholipid phosphatase